MSDSAIATFTPLTSTTAGKLAMASVASPAIFTGRYISARCAT